MTNPRLTTQDKPKPIHPSLKLFSEPLFLCRVTGQGAEGQRFGLKTGKHRPA